MDIYSLQLNLMLSIVIYLVMHYFFIKEDPQPYTLISNSYGEDQSMILDLLKKLRINDVKIQFWSKDLCPYRTDCVKINSLSNDFEITSSIFYGKYAKVTKLKVFLNGEEINVSSFGQDSNSSISDSDKMRIDGEYNNEVLSIIRSFYDQKSQIKTLN